MCENTSGFVSGFVVVSLWFRCGFVVGFEQAPCASAYIERLRQAAMSISKKRIGKAIANMKSRCELLYRARGGHFEEGGH